MPRVWWSHLAGQMMLQAEGGIIGRELPRGHGADFPLGHVHDVVNASNTLVLSVHAYFPPLTATAYDPVEGG
ncbi:hypothetical protein [Streptomyces kaempferi]|uniref:Cysteine dioxygenase type I n=1 Tax=Streptomyces kaempferi TaxID=333725 RepID=A0ABW3XYT5_9ACTN